MFDDLVGEDDGGVEDAADSFWLFVEAEEPFQADFSQPCRGAGNYSGNEVEGAADADGDFYVGEFGEVLVKPGFLGRGAEADKEDFGFAAADFFDEAGVVGVAVGLAGNF